MTDCTCHAGKICGICEVEVMGNLNKYAITVKGGITGTDMDIGSKLSDEEMEVAMEALQDIWKAPAGSKPCGDVGYDDCDCQVRTDVSNEPLLYPTPEKIERDILDELSMLRQKVADLDTAKAFHVSIYENIIERLKAAEDQVRIMDRVIGSLELQRLRGNG